MAFRGNTFNHFMREAKREYNERRTAQIVHKWRTPLWNELTDAQRMEWAQYMHDEYFNKPKMELNDMFGKFGGFPCELTWFDESAPFTKAMFDDVLKQRAFGKSIYLQQLGRAVLNEDEPVQVEVEIKRNAEGKVVSVSSYGHIRSVPRADGSDEHDYKDEAPKVDIGENEAVNRRVDALEKDSIQLGDELVRRFEVIDRRIAALEYEQPKEELAQAKADNETLCDDRKRLNETIAKRTDEINRLRDEAFKARMYTAELSATIEQKNLSIAGLHKQLDQAKTTEDTLRKVQEQLSQDLHAERSQPIPYTVSVEDCETIKRNIKEPWFKRARFFSTYNIVWMTKEQHEVVKRFAHFDEL